jgi:hypothetical protein
LARVAQVSHQRREATQEMILFLAQSLLPVAAREGIM